MRILIKVLVIGLMLALSPYILLAAMSLGGFALEGMGYYARTPTYEVAEIAARKRDPNECNKIWMIFDIAREQGSTVATCYFKTAQLLKDPAVCELLMPSSYGWSCVGEAKDKEPCTFGSYKNPTVGGNGIYATLEECKNGHSSIRSNACCVISRIKYLNGNDDCTLLSGSVDMSDQCHHEIALKTKSSLQCAFIHNKNIRSACEVQIRALLSE